MGLTFGRESSCISPHMKTKSLFLAVGTGLIFLLTQFKAGAAEHPAYLHALSDLRAARWMLEHRPGNWQQTEDEREAVKQIEAAVDEIKHASIDDGKDLNDHPRADENPEHAGRLRAALEFLAKARQDVNQDEDNHFANGLKDRALLHINEAINRTKKAVNAGAVSPGKADHPYYLHALEDLRSARWMLDHRPGDWQQSEDEREAVRRIDAAINEIKQASIDDGKDLNDHPPLDEKPEHMGRLRAALEFLEKARQDVNQDEDNAFANGLKDRAITHIAEAIIRTRKAIHS